MPEPEPAAGSGAAAEPGGRALAPRSPALPSTGGDGSEGCLRSGINDRANNDGEDEEVESAAALNAPAALRGCSQLRLHRRALRRGGGRREGEGLCLRGSGFVRLLTPCCHFR